MFRVIAGQQTCSSKFCCRSQEDTTFSTVKSVLLPETESCEAQLVNWHMPSPTATAGISTPQANQQTQKSPAAETKKFNTFIMKSVVLRQYILQIIKRVKKQTTTIQILQHIILFLFSSSGFQGQHCCIYGNKTKVWNVQISVAVAERGAIIQKNKLYISFLTLGQLLLDRHKLSKF